MSNLKGRIEGLKKRIDKTKKLKIQNEVIQEQTLTTLKKKFKVNDLDEARKCLSKKLTARKRLTATLEKKTKEFEKEFEEYLEDLGV